MRLLLPAWFVPCSLAVAALVSPVRAEALRPSAAQQVEANAAAVTSELRDVIAASDTLQGERLRELANPDSSRWGIRYRDGYLLFSIPVRKNLTLREKRDGELEAKNLALVTLGQKFSRLLALEDASQGLDPDAVRVILIEPDAERSYASAVGAGGFGGTGWHAGARGAMADCPCLPAPPPCGCE